MASATKIAFPPPPLQYSKRLNSHFIDGGNVFLVILLYAHKNTYSSEHDILMGNDKQRESVNIYTQPVWSKKLTSQQKREEKEI